MKINEIPEVLKSIIKNNRLYSEPQMRPVTLLQMVWNYGGRKIKNVTVISKSWS
jgi:hypothetical protein